MSKVLNLMKWGLTLGKQPQTFLGAKWIPPFLKRVPESKKRIWALRILSLSPHYFIKPDDPKYRGMSNKQYLETVFQDCAESRVKIYEGILKKHLNENQTVLDYGCGPGFLAKVVAPNVKKIYACDISTGALACARIVNAATNLEYVVADEEGLKSIPDESVDVVFSFALIQHLTDEVFEIVLENFRKKLKPNGLLLLHIQLEDDIWKTEEKWKSDKSVQGKIKYRYGLHCFGRTKEAHVEMVTKHQFAEIQIESVASMIDENFDDVYSQHILTARKV
jgi:SAM-dependent methyltransferase